MQKPSPQLTAPPLQPLLQDAALAGAWALDPRRSSFRAEEQHVGPGSGERRFPPGLRDGTVFPDGKVSGTLTAAAASIDTKNTRPDTHLRSADLLDSGNHPDITFTADGIRRSGRGAAVTGALTVRGRTLRLSFAAAASVHGDERDLARRRGPHQPGALRHHMKFDLHGLDVQHPHHPRRIHPAVSACELQARAPQSSSTARLPAGCALVAMKSPRPAATASAAAPQGPGKHLGGLPAVQTPQHRDER